MSTYHRIIRKMVVGFGNLFDNITLTRYNPDGTENQRFKVPIIYSPKEKYVARLVGDPNLDKKIQIALPRMSFDLLSMSYDSSRKQITNAKNSVLTSPTSGTRLYNPVPYNFNFSLYIYVRNIEDGTQIIEHILPFFTPEYTIKLNLIPDMNITKEIPILLNNVDYSVDFEGDRDSDTRIIIWTLNFTAKGFLYGSTSDAKIIKQVLTNIKNNNNVSTGNAPITFNMSPSGFGKYKDREVVYQGYSLDTATATAIVKSSSLAANTLTVDSINGNFTSNTLVIGVDSNAEYTLNSFSIGNNAWVAINVTTNPSNATANSNFTFVTHITEY